MKRLYTGIICLAFLVAGVAPAVNAQMGSVPSRAGSRGYNENMGMGYFKGNTWQDIMREAENTPLFEDAFTTIMRSRTYRLTRLDSRLTSRAIVWEQVKGSIVDELIGEITAEGKAGKNVSKKVYGQSGGISYELLPARADIKLILASLILVEKTDEDLAKGVLKLKAKARVALRRIVPLIGAIYDSPPAREDIGGVRRMATDAMREIVEIQEETAGIGEGSAENQRYNDAVNRLIAADHLERGRYFVLHGEPEKAVEAYTKSIETLPGLATAYRNRGGIYLHLEKHAEAMADFLNAYTSDAIGHTESRDFQACIDASEAALKLFEDYGAAYYQKAVCQVGLGEQKQAKNDFIKAAQLGEKRAQGVLSATGIAW